MGVNIGQAAKASGLSERMIRYFEKQGLIPAPERSGGGYRAYSDDDVRRMRTIALAQEVGFPTPVIAQLVSMMDKAKAEQAGSEADAEALAELDRKSEALAELRGRMGVMVERARSRLPEMNRLTPSPEPGPRRPSASTMMVLRQAAARVRDRELVGEQPETRGVEIVVEPARGRTRDLLGAD